MQGILGLDEGYIGIIPGYWKRKWRLPYYDRLYKSVFRNKPSCCENTAGFSLLCLRRRLGRCLGLVHGHPGSQDFSTEDVRMFTHKCRSPRNVLR